LDDLRLPLILSLRGAERLNLLPRLCGRPQALVIKSIGAIGHVNLYRKAWPDARVIVIIRHPCGQIASTLDGINRHKFASDTPIYDDEGLLDQLASTEQGRRHGLSKDRLVAMKPVERLAWMWAIPNEKAMDDAARDPNIRVMRYRDLCTAPLSEAQYLFHFAGISWDETVEAFIRDSTDPQQAKNEKYYSVFHDPELALDRWRSTLSGEEIGLIRNAIEGTTPERLFGFW
jgi:hypothetical protein